MVAVPLTVERLGAIGGQGVLCLRGPLTMENVLPFQNAIRREEKEESVIVDLSEVPYIDSSGSGVAGECVHHAPEGRTPGGAERRE